MAADDRNYWCLVASRYWTWGIREHVLKHGEFAWSVPADLRRGDMVVLYEMGKRPIGGGFKGRRMFPVIGRAETDAYPDVYWEYMADFTAIALEPPVTYEEVRDDPSIFGAWPALRAKFQSKLGNHVMPADVWPLLVARADVRDPGAAADIAALERGDDPPARGADRAPILAEGAFGDDVSPAVREKYVEQVFVEFLGQRGIARVATVADSLPRRGGNGHRIPDHHAFCDLLMVLPDGRLAVVEAESEAGADPKHGVNQVVRYRDQLIAAGLRSMPCVVAQSFTQAELDRAFEHDVECFEVFIDPESDFFDVVSVGPVGILTQLLDDGVRKDNGLVRHDLTAPEAWAAFGFLTDDDGLVIRTVYAIAVRDLQDQGYDISGLIGRIDDDSFNEAYGDWLNRVVEDFELPRTVDEAAIERLIAAQWDYMDQQGPRDVAPSNRAWPDGSAPYFLHYSEVAERFALAADEDGTVYPTLYFIALSELQEQGFDIGSLAGQMTLNVFYERYCDDFLDRMVKEFDLPLISADDLPPAS